MPAKGSWRFAPAQTFFLGFAPPALRVNGPLRNLPAFQEAFQCREGQGMVRPATERCAVW